MKNIINVLATGGTHLGDLCFWSLSEASISRTELEQKWANTSLANSLLPEPPTVTKAFKLAVRETQVGLNDTLIRPVVDDEASIIFAVVHEKKHDEGFLEYTQEAKVVLDLLHGTVRTDEPSHALVQAVQVRFLELKNTHTPDDIRRTMTRTLQSFQAVLLRENGGVWWVPAPYAASLRKLQACIESIGSSKVYLLPVHDSADAHRTLRDAATKSLESELAALKQEVESFVAKPPERTSTLVRRFDAFDELRSRAELYRDILSVQAKDLDSTLTQLAVSIESLLSSKPSA